MKKYFIMLGLVCGFLPTSYAETPLTNPPQYINLQAVLVDDGGNVLTDRQESDINFRVVDISGNVLYEETQHVILVYGAISVLIGQGNDPTTGEAKTGIPAEAFSPDGDRFLEIQLADQTIPQEKIQIVSVPYSYYSEYTLHVANPIGTTDILDSTIAVVDLSQEVLDYIGNATGGGTAATTADAVSVSNSFVNLSGDNVQDILQSVDTAINLRSADGTILENDLATEITNRETADAALQSSIDGLDTRVTNIENGTTFDSRYVNIDGDDMTGPLSAPSFTGDGSNITNINGVNIQQNTVTGLQITDGSVATSDMANQNVSQWTNDSGYITDGNTGWDNTYGFITDGNDGWDNDYGFLTSTDTTGWDKDDDDDLTNSTTFSGDISGTYNALDLGAGVVGSSEIGDNSVTSSDIENSTITGNDLATGAVSGIHIQNFSITGDDLQVGSVASTAIQDNSIETSDLNSVSFENWDQDASDDLSLSQADARYLKTDGSNDMAGDMSMDDTTCAANSGHNCYVDGVDVSELAADVEDLKDVDTTTTPAYDTVTITGTAPNGGTAGNPTAHTIYKENQILAWGKVDSQWDNAVDPTHPVSLVGNFNLSTTIERGPNLDSGSSCGDSCYKFFFLTQPTDESSYVVQVIVNDASSNSFAVVREYSAASFIIALIDPTGADPRAANIDIVVVGY